LISELIKLHILGVWQNAYEFIRQPAIIMSETPNLQTKEDNDKPRKILRHKKYSTHFLSRGTVRKVVISEAAMVLRDSVEPFLCCREISLKARQPLILIQN